MKLNLGCGYRKLNGFINIDNRIECNPDLVCDLTESIPFEDDSIDEIKCYDFLEHLPRNRFVPFMEEVYRVLKLGGIFEHFTPSDEGRGFAQDPYHTNAMNLNSWWYFTLDEYIDLYGTKCKLEGSNKNILTDPKNKIIHVYGLMKKVPL